MDLPAGRRDACATFIIPPEEMRARYARLKPIREIKTPKVFGAGRWMCWTIFCFTVLQHPGPAGKTSNQPCSKPNQLYNSESPLFGKKKQSCNALNWSCFPICKTAMPHAVLFWSFQCGLCSKQFRLCHFNAAKWACFATTFPTGA
ncbi:MAG: hypothetical protein ABSF60_06020 [Verrucomicrobiota bacterium]